MIGSFLILFLFKAVSEITSASASEYNHTKILNDTIVQLFQKYDYAAKSEEILSKVVQGHDRYKYEAKNPKKLKPFGSKIVLNIPNITLTGHPRTVHMDFEKNETNICFGKIDCTFQGTTYITRNETKVEFTAYIDCLNYRLHLIRSSTTGSNEKKIHINTSCDAFLTAERESKIDNPEKIPYKTQLNILHTIGIVLPSVLHDLFLNNNHLENFLEESFRNPSLSMSLPVNVRQPQYFTIPSISIMYLHLTNIKIIGLENFQSYGQNLTLSKYAHTLILSDIRGYMDATHDLVQKPPMGLNFTVGHLYVSVDKKNNTIWVEAREYSIFQANSQSIPSIDETIELLESVIGQSIMPSMKVEAVSRRGSPTNLNEMERCYFRLLKNATTN